MGGLRAKYFLSCCCIIYSLKFYMQHDHVLKQLNVHLLTPSPGPGDAVVCGQNTCYHVAAYVILLNLICNMTIFCVCGQNICYPVAAYVILLNFDMQHDHVLKKLNFDLLTPSGGGVSEQNICYHVAAFVILFNLVCNMAMF